MTPLVERMPVGDSEYLFRQKELQRSDENGNAINFFVTVAKGLIYQPESHLALEEAINNALALVAEHPLAETVKVDTREEQWEYDSEKKALRLRGVFGYLDDILVSALRSSQTSNFEVPRFEANLNNYQKLRSGRMGGDRRVFVEFRPSPLLTSEARSRGYQGNDCIFFYRYDPVTQKETVTQRWLNAGVKKFNDLLWDLEVISQDIYLDDAQIMNKSNFFDSAAIAVIEQLIDANNGEALSGRTAIQHYVDTELRDFVANEITSLLKTGASKLLQEENIEHELREFVTSLVYAQLKLRNKLDELTGLRTVAPVRLEAHEIAFFDTHKSDRLAFLQENKEKVVLSGCGVSVEDMFSQITGKSSSSFASAFGAAGGMGEALFGEGEDFPCPNPNCQKMLSKKERQAGKCDGCGLTKQQAAKDQGVPECA